MRRRDTRSSRISWEETGWVRRRAQGVSRWSEALYIMFVCRRQLIQLARLMTPTISERCYMRETSRGIVKFLRLTSDELTLPLRVNSICARANLLSIAPHLATFRERIRACANFRLGSRPVLSPLSVVATSRCIRNLRLRAQSPECHLVVGRQTSNHPHCNFYQHLENVSPKVRHPAASSAQCHEQDCSALTNHDAVHCPRLLAET